MESATIKTPSAPRNGNLRAYLAGGGATAALVAAAVVVFVGVAAFVGFNGLPFGADDSPDSTVNLAADVPEAAAGAAAGPPRGPLRPIRSLPARAAIAEILASLPPGSTSDVPGVTGLVPGVDGGDPGVVAARRHAAPPRRRPARSAARSTTSRTPPAEPA